MTGMCIGDDFLGTSHSSIVDTWFSCLPLTWSRYLLLAEILSVHQIAKTLPSSRSLLITSWKVLSLLLLSAQKAGTALPLSL